MIKKESRNEMRMIRHARIRKQIIGTKEIPRLNVYRSNKNISVQLFHFISSAGSTSVAPSAILIIPSTKVPSLMRIIPSVTSSG